MGTRVIATDEEVRRTAEKCDITLGAVGSMTACFSTTGMKMA
jgi:hypothetical protein